MRNGSKLCWRLADPSACYCSESRRYVWADLWAASIVLHLHAGMHDGMDPLRGDWSCNRPVPLQSPGTPKPQKRISLRSEKKKPFWTPRKKGPTSQLKCAKSPFCFGTFYFPIKGPFGHLIDCWGHFSGGSKVLFFRTLNKRFGGFGVPGPCRETGRL